MVIGPIMINIYSCRWNEFHQKYGFGMENFFHIRNKQQQASRDRTASRLLITSQRTCHRTHSITYASCSLCTNWILAAISCCSAGRTAFVWLPTPRGTHNDDTNHCSLFICHIKSWKHSSHAACFRLFVCLLSVHRYGCPSELCVLFLFGKQKKKKSWRRRKYHNFIDETQEI